MGFTNHLETGGGLPYSHDNVSDGKDPPSADGEVCPSIQDRGAGEDLSRHLQLTTV